jgi:hypothetical protein
LLKPIRIFFVGLFDGLEAVLEFVQGHSEVVVGPVCGIDLLGGQDGVLVGGPDGGFEPW